MIVVVSARSKECVNEKPDHPLTKKFTEFSSIVSALQRNRHKSEFEHRVLGLKLTVALLQFFQGGLQDFNLFLSRCKEWYLLCAQLNQRLHIVIH